MVNTRAHPSVKGWEDPAHSLYYLVIVQVRAHAVCKRSSLCQLASPAADSWLTCLHWRVNQRCSHTCPATAAILIYCQVYTDLCHQPISMFSSRRKACFFETISSSCMLLQYTARLHAEKLKNFIHKLGGGKYGKQYYNMRVSASCSRQDLARVHCVVSTGLGDCLSPPPCGIP